MGGALILMGERQLHHRLDQQMTKPENDSELSQLTVDVQHLAGTLDAVTRERGIRGVADVLANIQAKAREAEWRCNKLMGPWWTRVF